jgi:hypothetical protein
LESIFLVFSGLVAGATATDSSFAESKRFDDDDDDNDAGKQRKAREQAGLKCN